VFNLTSLLSPYLLYLKIAAAVAIVAAVFLAGVRWESASCERALNKRQIAEQEAIDAIRADNELQLRLQEAMRQAAEERLAIANRKHNKEGADAQRKIRDFYSKYSGCRVSLERERLWRETNGESGERLPEADPASSGTIVTTGRCTEADLHSNHATLVTRFKQNQKRLEELQLWARNALSVCNR